MLKPVFEVPYFTRKAFLKKIFFQNFQDPLFLTGGLYRYHFRSASRHLSALFKKGSLATLVNIKQKS